MLIRKLAIIASIVLLSAGSSFAELTTSQIAKKYSPSVVTIVALDENDQPLALGSGFFINTKGDIATNYHVLEGSSKAIIKTTNGKTGEILEIIKYDPELDLLIAKTTLKNTILLPLGDSDTILVGDDIVAIGNPAGLEGTVSKGIISGVREVDGFKFIQITAPISPGSSGGPVFNSDGRVIGIATAYLEYGQNLNFAMPINYLKSLKPKRMKLGSLPKKKAKTKTGRDNSLVKIIAVSLNSVSYSRDDLSMIDFSIKNNSNHIIKNVKVFFIYRKRGEVISYSSETFKKSILPKLALQFKHWHGVRNFYYRGPLPKGYGMGRVSDKVEIRILDFEINRSGSSYPSDMLLK